MIVENRLQYNHTPAAVEHNIAVWRMRGFADRAVDFAAAIAKHSKIESLQDWDDIPQQVME